MDAARTHAWLVNALTSAGAENHSTLFRPPGVAGPVVIHATTPWGDDVAVQVFER